MSRLEAFMSQVLWNGDPDECWTWGQVPNTTGYGRFTFEGYRTLAHRAAYELFRGPIPEGLHIDHLCRNRICVNPAHLEAVSCKTNVLRGVGPTAVNAQKKVCKRGHPLTPANTYTYRSSGNRCCLACKKLLKKRWTEQRRRPVSKTEDK